MDIQRLVSSGSLSSPFAVPCCVFRVLGYSNEFFPRNSTCMDFVPLTELRKIPLGRRNRQVAPDSKRAELSHFPVHNYYSIFFVFFYSCPPSPPPPDMSIAFRRLKKGLLKKALRRLKPTIFRWLGARCPAPLVDNRLIRLLSEVTIL